MSNSKKITPSLSQRKAYLLFSSKSFMKGFWIILGAIIAIIGIVVAICIGDKEFATNSDSTEYMVGYVCGFILAGMGVLCIIVGCLIASLYTKLLKSGETQYPIANIQISKNDMLQDVLNFNIANNSKIQVEVVGDWIDVTLNWKNCFSIVPGRVYIDKSIYKKMICLKDNYTYQELDFEGTGAIDLSLGSCYIEKSFKCGHIIHHAIEYSFGEDLNSGNMGINKYTLSTAYVANEIHKWLAEHGYKPVG